MENTIRIQTGKTLHAESLLAVSALLMDVNRTIRSIHMIVFLLLHYVRIGLSIANGLVDMIA